MPYNSIPSSCCDSHSETDHMMKTLYLTMILVALLLNGVKGKDQALGGTTFDPAAMMGQSGRQVNVKRLYDLETFEPMVRRVLHKRWSPPDD